MDISLKSPDCLAPRETVARRFFRRAFARFLIFAVFLTLILIGEALWRAQENLKGELAIYQRTFEKALAAALWSMDHEKLVSIASGIIEIPDIKAVRIIDPHDDALIVRVGSQPIAAEPVRNGLVLRFDVIHDEGFGREVVGRAEFHSSFGQVLQRSQGQMVLIVVLATLKTLAFWWIFLHVGQRVLGRPLTEMTQAIAVSRSAQPLALSSTTENAIADTELAMLRSAYDGMAARVHDAQLELKQANEVLEQRVMERTRELQETSLKLEELANTDALTGLANRRQFIALSQIEIARSHRTGRPLALIVCDIDLFKQINDTYGHAVGDRALCHLAQRLHETVREVDIVARFGGDEFVVMLPDIGLEEARAVAERVREHIAETPLVLDDGHPVTITLSLGVTALEAADDGLEALFQRADAGLFGAKSRGRNCVADQS